MSNDEPSNPGELREDIPLRPNDSAGFSRKFGGIRLIILSFVVLTIAVTVALASQIYYGDFEVVPHGSVASDSVECSSIGTDVLKAGGNSVDAAIAAAFCLSVVNPHTTGLDAGGVIMMYDYRQSRAVGVEPPPPIVVDFSESTPSSTPQLVKGLAFIHSKFGKMKWSKLIQPAADLARSGFSVPSTLVAAIQAVEANSLFPSIEAGHNITNKNLTAYLEILAMADENSLFPDASTSGITMTEASSFVFGDFTIYTPSSTTSTTLIKLLGATLRFNQTAENFISPEMVYRRAYNLKLTLKESTSPGPASTVAVIDKEDYYVSLITGLHVLLGSQRFAPEGYIVNEPPPIPATGPTVYSAFSPLILTQLYTCGERIVLSCGEIIGAAQVIGSLMTRNVPVLNRLAAALEGPRIRLLPFPTIAFEKSHQPRFNDVVLQALRGLGPLSVAPEPYPTCNAIQQVEDALASHADSRGGGIASRF